MDESNAAVQSLATPGGQQPQQQPNQLAGVTQQPQQQPRPTRDQTIAGLHHFSAIQKQFGPLLKNTGLGQSNMRPKIFDAAANLVGEQVVSVPEVMNAIKDLPDDPIGQKKWVEHMVGTAAMAQKKLISDFMQNGEDTGEPSAWSADSHRDHVKGLMAHYKR